MGEQSSKQRPAPEFLLKTSLGLDQYGSSFFIFSNVFHSASAFALSPRRWNLAKILIVFTPASFHEPFPRSARGDSLRVEIA
jgi:hypothetical protein